MLIDDVWISPSMVGEVSDLCGVHRTTVARWLQRRELPRLAHKVLNLVLHGRLQEIHPAWAGWSIDHKSGELVTPLGRSVTAPEILAMQLRYQHIAALEVELRELRKSIDATMQADEQEKQMHVR